MKKLKNISRYIHEWLGLTSGLIVFIVALSGTIFVFCDEVIDVAGGAAKYVAVPDNAKKLPYEALLHRFKKNYPNRGVFYFDDFKSPERSFRIASHLKGKDFTHTYVNPYSGEILRSSKSYWFFFYLAAKIHSAILLGKTGQTIVGISTIIFFFELLTGLVLWFPKKWNKKARQASFTIKKGTKWKKKVYDLHKVLGFYALIPALLITVTGLIMSFKTINDATQHIFGGAPDGHEAMKQYYPKFAENKSMKPIDTIINKLYSLYPEAKQIRLGYPYGKKPMAHFQGVVAQEIGLKTWKKGEMVLIDRYKGQIITLPKSLHNHEVIEQTVFDLHSGFWLGKTGKIITFMIGLICTSLPVTGFIFWLSRKKSFKV